MTLVNILYIISWVGTFAAMLGAYFVAVKGNKIGFLIFLIGDACLVGIQIHDHIWSQVFILSYFGITNLIGYFKKPKILKCPHCKQMGDNGII